MGRFFSSAIGRQIGTVALVLASPVSVIATPDTHAPPATRYALAAWSTEQAGDVFAIAQDLDGYLWLGTQEGLVRFDGSRFQRWAQGSSGASLPARPVPALVSSSQGGVWVAFNGGGGVARIDRAGITHYSPADGAPSGVNALLEDRRGTLWAATSGGLFRYAGSHWSRVTQADGYEGEEAFSVYEDRASHVWVGTARGLYRHDGRLLQLVDSTATSVDSLVQDDAGNVWVTNRATIVRKLETPSPLRVDSRVRLPLPGWRIIPDGRGALLVASFSGGLFRVADPTGAHPLLEPIEYEDRMRGSPRALYRDRDDNIWVGMRGGLLRLSENTFQAAGPLDGLNKDGVRTAAVAADGTIWIATTQALNRLVGTSRRSFAVSQTRALYADRLGGMWVATDEFVGRYTMDRLIKERIPDVEASRVNGLTTTADALWLCTASRGVVSWNGKTLSSYPQPEESGGHCSSILADRHERVWAGFTSGGVALLEQGRVRVLTEHDGLAPGLVWQIVQGNDDAVWFATSGGVSRYQHGRFTSVTATHAPIAGVVPMLVEDAEDYVWVGLHSGAALMRFHAGEMDKIEKDANYRLSYTLYDESDGLHTQMWQNGAAAVRDTAGRIWVVNGPGMTIIDPRQLREPRRASPPSLETVSVNGQRINNPAAVRRFANGSTLQIEYGALALSATSKLRFRHLLDGVDGEWVYDTDSRRATYANLRAGDYRFRVSTTEGGPWTELSLWAFTVDPPFYLRGWFLVAVGMVLVGGTATTARLHVRAVKARYALVIAERTRLSREIHDTLLQSLAALGPELEALATRASSPEGGMTSELRRLRRQVDRSVRDARESILELRRHAMSSPRLAQSLAQLAHDTETRHDVRVTVAVEGRRPDSASPDVDLQLFRIAQEAVINAIRHGRPTRIDISVSYAARRVALTIADDGCGFDMHAKTSAHRNNDHWGLVTMRERAEQVGGELRIVTSPGAGTTVHAVAGLTNEWV